MARQDAPIRDEELLYSAQPSWTSVVRPIALSAVLLGGAVAGFVLWSSAPLWFGVVILVAALVALLIATLAVARWRATSLAVTSSSVIYRSGLVRRYRREIPIGSVQDVSMHQGVLERLARAGSVTVESAGERGTLPFVDVARPYDFQSAVQSAIADRQRPPRRAAPGADRPVTHSIPEQIAQLADLYRGGVLTEEEFTRKKSELLERM